MPHCERTFVTLPRCSQHPGDLLTMEGTCPRCDRESFAAHMAVVANAKEAAKLQALTRADRGVLDGDRSRRHMGEAEATRLAGAA